MLKLKRTWMNEKLESGLQRVLNDGDNLVKVG